MLHINRFAHIAHHTPVLLSDRVRDYIHGEVPAVVLLDKRNSSEKQVSFHLPASDSTHLMGFQLRVNEWEDSDVVLLSDSETQHG